MEEQQNKFGCILCGKVYATKKEKKSCELKHWKKWIFDSEKWKNEVELKIQELKERKEYICRNIQLGEQKVKECEELFLEGEENG